MRPPPTAIPPRTVFSGSQQSLWVFTAALHPMVATLARPPGRPPAGDISCGSFSDLRSSHGIETDGVPHGLTGMVVVVDHSPFVGQLLHDLQPSSVSFARER